jgi:hypothetical protein
MSLFVAWHTLAMTIAPAPSNSLTDSLRVVLQPYLSLFRLDNKWDFFAANIGVGSLFRYVIEDQTGEKHTFNPAEQLSWFHPSYLWFRFWYYAIMENPELFADDAAARFCRKHADLHPVGITLLELREKEFMPSDLLEGKLRTDPEFYTVITIKRDKCAQ